MVIVRFAPSPTGVLHLGSARTAIFNWVYAKHTNGKFFLRIEDTDKERSNKKYLDEILNDLKWLGIDWEQDVIFQSNRFDIYREYAENLLKQGKAYKDGEAIIFKVEKNKTIEIEDQIHGKITFNTNDIKDQVMIKSDGSSAYNFSCVVDDAYQKCTHIIRGDDHISNTPKQVLFYEALGYSVPKFAHIPLIMGNDGTKLSKRHGAVAVEEYKKQGILPEALFNYLLLLGWSFGDDKEIFSVKEAIDCFELTNVNDVQVKFDTQKLRWMNGEYIAKTEKKDLFCLLKERIINSGVSIDNINDEKLDKLIDLYKTRAKTLLEFVNLTNCFFKEDYPIDEKGQRKYLEPEECKDNISLFLKELEKLEEFSSKNIEDICRNISEQNNIKASKIIHPTRMAISGQTVGAGLFEMMEVLGKHTVLKRMKNAL